MVKWNIFWKKLLWILRHKCTNFNKNFNFEPILGKDFAEIFVYVYFLLYIFYYIYLKNKFKK